MYNYGRLKKQFGRWDVTKASFKDVKVTNLGSSSWELVSEPSKQLYYRRATGEERNGILKGWYVPKTDDLVTPYGDHLLGWLDQYITVVSNYLDDEFLRLPIVRFRESIVEKKGIRRSYFTNPLLVKGLYDQTFKPDKSKIPLTPGPLVKRIFKALIREFDAAIKVLQRLPAEEQTEKLLIELPAEKNIGFPFYVPQSKKTFSAQWTKAVKRKYGKSFPFTVDGLIDFVNAFGEDDRLHVYLLLFRSKDENVSRAVYGGEAIGKGIGCLFSALRKVEGFQLPFVGDLPMTSWEDWSQLFPRIEDLVTLWLDKGRESIGDDIVNFDGQAKPNDLDWISDYTGVSVKFMIYILEGMKKCVVYYGPFILKGIFFVSGNPFTQLFGTLIHMMLSEAYAIEYDRKLLHGIWQSDDDLIFYDDADVTEMNDCFTAFGYPISIPKTHSLKNHKVVQYLKVYIGRIFNSNDVSFIGNIVSRYINMIHRERGSPEIFYKFPTSDNVNMFIGQTASYSENGVQIVSEIYDELKFTPIVSEAIRILRKYEAGDITYDTVRPDLLVGFKPDWLVRAI